MFSLRKGFIEEWSVGNVSHLFDAESFIAYAVILQHEMRPPLGRGDELSLGMLIDL